MPQEFIDVLVESMEEEEGDQGESRGGLCKLQNFTDTPYDYDN